MTSARDIAFTRHGAARGFAWLKDSYAMFRSVRLAWILLLTSYYLVLLVIDLVPLVGGFAAPLLKPVFAVGFLAAAWTQERGGVRRYVNCSRAFAPISSRLARSASCSSSEC
jgi:hypothetical protein